MSIIVRDYPGGRKEVDIRVRLPNGEMLRRRLIAPVPSQSGARRWGEARERDLLDKALRNGGDTKEKPIPTFDAFAPRFIDDYAKANGQKLSSVQSKQSVLDRYLLPRFGNKRLHELTDLDVQKLKSAMLEKELNPKTINNVLSVLSKLLKVAVSWREIREMPVHIELLRTQTKDMEFYSTPDYSALTGAAESLGPTYELLVRLGGDAGLRRGEMMALERRDIDFHRHAVLVSRSVVRGIEGGTKSMKPRTVPMTPRLEALIKQRFDDAKGKLLGAKGEAPTPKTLRVRMMHIQKAAGLVTNGALHILRHTFCSHLAMAGVPVLEIQRLAGHAHLSTTMKYMHLAPNADLKEAVASLAAVRAKAVSGGSGPKLHVVRGGVQGDAEKPDTEDHGRKAGHDE